jgi:hypothetical protein
VISPESNPRDWNPVQRIAFRFWCVFFVLYALPFPLDFMSGGDGPAWYQWLWDGIVPWVGAHILHVSDPIPPGGSVGWDGAFGYVQLMCFAILAAGATVVWSAVDRRRGSGGVPRCSASSSSRLR